MLALGAVMVYSASSAESLLEWLEDPSFYLKRYVLFGLAGLVVLHARLALAACRCVQRLTPPLLLGSFVLTVP